MLKIDSFAGYSSSVSRPCLDKYEKVMVADVIGLEKFSKPKLSKRGWDLYQPALQVTNFSIIQVL